MRNSCVHLFLILGIAVFACTDCNGQKNADLRKAMATQAELGEYENAVAIATKILEAEPEDLGIYVARGEMNYMAGNMAESVADFDNIIELEPTLKPRLWQRGLALYYVERFAEAAEQFESHRTFNAQDVENAVWHFACKARGENLEAAQESLIPIERDPRVPMMEIHKLYSGKMDVADVIKAAQGDGTVGKRNVAQHTFYAHFYCGLYYESIGDHEKCLEQMELAVAEENFFPKQILMGQVASVHLMMRKKKESTKSSDE